MTGSMYAAISGLRAHMQNLNVIGNNIANVNTYSYKAARSVFKSSLYTTLSGGSDGTATVGGTNPSQIGYGVTTASVDIDMSAGTYSVTGKSTDVMLQGDGFFLVGDKTLAGNFNGTADDVTSLTALTLTRVGNFEFKSDGYLTNENGDVVYGFLCTGVYTEGETLPAGKEVGDPKFSDQLVPIRFPRVAVDATTGAVSIAYPRTTGDGVVGNHLADAAEDLSFAEFEGITFDSKTGLITGTSKDTEAIVTIGCLAVGSVTNPNGVTQIGDSYYKAGEGSGRLTINVLGGGAEEMGIHYVNGSLRTENAGANAGAVPGQNAVDGLRIRNSAVELLTSGLEMSKTDLAQEIANMIVTQRGYQANTRIVTVTDSMLEELVNMKR